ncbi:MAG: hypothetical protein WBZ37_16600 [Mycobacterium sp.]
MAADNDKAEGLAGHFAKMPHYHVVTQHDGRYLDYSDGLTEPGAVAYAADLISPLSGGREQGLEAVWLVQVDPRTCPLAHGADPGKDSEDALMFLDRVTQDDPYWWALG